MLSLDLIVLGLAITLEPVPLTAFVLVLASANGTRKAGAFLLGWVLSLAVVVALTMSVTGDQPPASQSAPATAALAVKLAIGAALVALGGWRWRKRGLPQPPKKAPKWQTGIDAMGLPFAFALGPLVQPWGLVAAGVASIVGDESNSTSDYVVLAFFLLLSVSTYLALWLYALLRPVPTTTLLERIRTWIDAHQQQVLTWLALVVGVWLVATSAYHLLS